jgi:hypothetical protein
MRKVIETKRSADFAKGKLRVLPLDPKAWEPDFDPGSDNKKVYCYLEIG